MNAQGFQQEREAYDRFKDIDEAIDLARLSQTQKIEHEALCLKAASLHFAPDDISSEDVIAGIQQCTEEMRRLWGKAQASSPPQEDRLE